MAEQFYYKYSYKSDEVIFQVKWFNDLRTFNNEHTYWLQEIRRVVSAVIQTITYDEFLPVVIGTDAMNYFNLWILKVGYSADYDDDVDATIFNGFATAAFR